MSFEDWVNTIAFLAIGVFLGMAAYLLAGVVLSGGWVVALAVIIPWGIWLLFYLLLERLSDRVFGIGIKPARDAAARPKPLARRLSLPVGLTLGACAAWLGLTETILGVV